MKSEKYEIVVSGAARCSHCAQNIEEIAKEVGREIARRKCNLVTGATTGIPYFSALGCNEAGGFNIGFSPAVSESAHIKTYKLPLEPFDIMIYTGADYTGRNVMMTKSADGVIIICGRMGTLHEFVTAFELQKPIGVLEGTGGTADKIRTIATGPYRGVNKIIYERDPKKLVDRLINQIEQEKKANSSSLKRSRK
ncbi:MAG: hypothetical protein V1705_00480 [bacterium]